MNTKKRNNNLRVMIFGGKNDQISYLNILIKIIIINIFNNC